uniref:NADH-ubiquinone oxidoreductase chain 5 n=1 Tax=Holothuria pervicax TaxID=2080420 RepID=A0A6B9XS08_9ECHN|nr:NADH dehydrogenase subunit 5 [Holothuria pervicax]QHR85451.1 NADH dehydrogenase subunit 5 [Holothuria pervicax]
MTINPSTAITSISLVILVSLIITFTVTSKNTSNSVRAVPNGQIALTTMKILSTVSLINILIFYLNPESTTSNLIPWMSSNLDSVLSLSLDNKFLFFSATALIVTWSIMEFSVYYMASDPLNPNFFRLLIIFLLNMLVLTSSNNLFLFFIGWEGVGFLSFLLIGWWFTRQDANTSALQAVIYNRIGDIGIILLISISLFINNTWNINGFLPQTLYNWEANIVLLACLLAAIGKSAQFGLHPWLPAAMEGPTPVSALLHSSTMVVAGVFLLIRITSIIEPSNIFLNLCLITGSLTAIFAATSAFFQHDIKKIIAYSTTSQLGLMVVAIGFNQPLIAFFHICTHAFFKAMLFLCSGSLIHSYNNEQDLRKMSNTNNTAPITSACLLLGSVALMGIPFLSGFYSKDLILETIALSPSNLVSYTLAIIATLLTAGYSFRIVSFCFLNTPSNTPSNPINEESPNLYNPLIRLSIGAIVVGWLLSSHCFSLPTVMPLPSIKTLPLLVTLIGASISSTIIIYSKKNNTYSTSFLTKTWFFDRLSHPNLINALNTIALTSTTRTLDRGWSETSGGQGIFATINSASKAAQTTQTGYIKQYLLSIITLIIIIFLASITI